MGMIHVLIIYAFIIFMFQLLLLVHSVIFVLLYVPFMMFVSLIFNILCCA